MGVFFGDVIYVMLLDVLLLDLVGCGVDGLCMVGEWVVCLLVVVVVFDEVMLVVLILCLLLIWDLLCFLDYMCNCQEVMGGGWVFMDIWYCILVFYFVCLLMVLGLYDDVFIVFGSVWQDFELEIVVVIGISGKDLIVEQVEWLIIGYIIFNDWFVWDLQMLEGQLCIGQVKGKDSGIILGFYLVILDELEFYCWGGKLSLWVIVLVNGIVIGLGLIVQMDWSFGEVIVYVLWGVMLILGDVFGLGMVFICMFVEYFRLLELFLGWLYDGDVVIFQVEGLGEMRQIVWMSGIFFLLVFWLNLDVEFDWCGVNLVLMWVLFICGLYEVVDWVWVWMLFVGGYGFSNVGLVVGDGVLLFVDILFDLVLICEMLVVMKLVIEWVFIIDVLIMYFNGDYMYGI